MPVQDHSSSFNHLGPPPGAQDFLSEHAAQIVSQYSGDSMGRLATIALADFYGVHESAVSLTQGSTEAIFTAPRMWRSEGARTAQITDPAFWEYDIACKREGIVVSRAPDKGEFVIADDPDIVFVNNPLNPTGTLYERDSLLGAVDAHPGTQFLVDETYLVFRQDFSERTLSQDAATIPNLHVAHSLSKFFTVPGIRAGVFISDPGTISQFEQYRVPYATSKLTELIVPWLLAQSVFIDRTRQEHEELRIMSADMYKVALSGVAEVIEPTSNFITLRDMSRDSEDVVGALRDRGILVRGGHEFGERHRRMLRASLKPEKETSILVNALKNALRA